MTTHFALAMGEEYDLPDGINCVLVIGKDSQRLIEITESVEEHGARLLVVTEDQYGDRDWESFLEERHND